MNRLEKIGHAISIARSREVGRMAEAKPDTVAVVDDDDAVRDAMRLFLEVVGHKVATFSSAADFLNADHGLMTCVLLDHHMPHMTGLELVERLRASGVGIPIMLVTGSPSSSIVARAAELGIAQVIEKPPAEDDLLAFIDAAK
jgi:FixJ family two-component response regulator